MSVSIIYFSEFLFAGASDIIELRVRLKLGRAKVQNILSLS